MHSSKIRPTLLPERGRRETATIPPTANPIPNAGERAGKKQLSMQSDIQITNRNDTCFVDIEGVIGVPEEWQFDQPSSRVATYEKFRDSLDRLREIDAPEIVVNIRSTGGDVNDALLIYEAEPNGYAPPAAGGTITNTASITGNGLTTPLTAQATVAAGETLRLSISKCMSPTSVVENGTVTYTFYLQNSGNTATAAADYVIVTDTFDPILSGLTVTLDGAPLTLGTDYTYDTATGAFATTAGTITVPAAAAAQDAETGLWRITPGVTKLVITGTV